jgi:hypothetical protein
MKIVVVNKRTCKKKNFYVGRPTILGNLFSIDFGKCDEAIERYKVWFDSVKESPEYKRTLDLLYEEALKGELRLSCWCSPKSCHADVIRHYLLDRYERETRDV